MIDPSAHSVLGDRPCLQSDCTVTPTVIRQEHWVIIKNVITGSHIRLHRELWSAVVELDGTCTVQQWLARYVEVFGERQLLSVLVQLRRLGILDAQDFQGASESWLMRFFTRLNPLMLRLPLFNPNALLGLLSRATSVVSAKAVFACFYIVVFAALYTAIMNWSSIVTFWHSVDSRTQFWYVVFLYPLTKSLHELAHGLVLRRLGGQVPEAGVSFIVLFPMPYVDATDAWTLHRKQRILVSAAGMMMDLLVASVGIVVWYNLSSGVIAHVAFTAALMGVVSIVLFNANPLLKFDGYYVLEDALDSPGLARRSQAYYRYLFKRFVLAVDTSTPPAVGHGEKLWMLSYGAASTGYRFIIAAVICVYLVSTLHELGVLLSLFSLIPLCVFPIYRFLQFLLASNELSSVRLRSISITLVLLLFIAGTLFVVPMPSSTRTQGIVWVDQQAEVYATQTGQLERILVNNGDLVQKGQPLMVLDSVDLMYALEKKRAQVRLAKLDVTRYRRSDPNLAASAQIMLKQSESEVENARAQVAKLTIRSPAQGRVAMGDRHIAKGLHVSQGMLLAYVVDGSTRVIRAVVDQSALGDVEAGVRAVQVRIAQNMTRSLNASISRQVPSGSHQLPSAALINTGIDGFDVEQVTADEPLKTREKVFHLELLLDDPSDELQQVPMGARAFVTLTHAHEPLAQRWMRVSRQLLLKHLSV